MSKSYRIRTEVGKDKFLQVKLDQDYDKLELLSLAIFPNDVYTRNCAEFGVVCGRVFSNRGLGMPNARVSIFIRLQPEDEENPIISTLYPYRTFEQFNEDGYKYNLLPYTQSHSGHVPVGTFPDRDDVLKNQSVIEVYDKYYKFTAKTNNAGDFMIFGIPVGQHDLFMQVDLSDIGEFSLTPQDLLRSGRATETQIDGTKFKFSENYSELPQIVTLTKTIQVAPFFGQKEICDYYITRADFDLTLEASIEIRPTSVFMGSIISTVDRRKLKNNCKVPAKQGWLCDLVAGPGAIETIRQTVFVDDEGLPILENFVLEKDGNVIDENGAWLVELPMNLGFIYTDELGNRVESPDGSKGVPTKAKYRFKVKWNQSTFLSEETKRAYFLIPNIKEWGWTASDEDPIDTASVTTITLTIQPTDSLPQTLSSQGGYSVLETLTNIESFEIDLVIYDNELNEISRVKKPDYKSAIPFEELDALYGSNYDVQIVNYVLADTNSEGKISYLNYDEQSYKTLSSYAFSTSWIEYGTPDMRNEALNCEDRFYEFEYNKVYTISQLLDRYTSKGINLFLPQRTIQIKHITENRCEAEFNKFPTNDSYYRYDIIFIIISFILTFMKFIFIPILIILHFLAWIWPFILAVVNALIAAWNFLIIRICGVIRRACSFFGFSCNWLGECREKDKLPEDNPFKNIKLPVILNTEDGCQACRCRLDDYDAFANHPNATQLNQVLNSLQIRNTTVLANLTSRNSYTGMTNTAYLNSLGGGFPVLDDDMPEDVTPSFGVYNYELIDSLLVQAAFYGKYNFNGEYCDTPTYLKKLTGTYALNTYNQFYTDTKLVAIEEYTDEAQQNFLMNRALCFVEILMGPDSAFSGPKDLNQFAAGSAANEDSLLHTWRLPVFPNLVGLEEGEIQKFTYDSYSVAWSSQLPIAERINLFNTKAKYYDNVGEFSPGDTGWNQIKTRFFSNVTENDTKEHYDNVIVIAIDSFSSLTIGDLITFQRPGDSNDPNAKVANGIYEIPLAFTAKYANPNYEDGGFDATTYYTTTPPANSGDLIFGEAIQFSDGSSPQPTIPQQFTTTCYPADIEYFQVIRVESLSEFKSKAAPLDKGGDNRFSLPWRFLDTSYTKYFNSVRSSGALDYDSFTPDGSLSPTDDDFNNSCMFMREFSSPNNSYEKWNYTPAICNGLVNVPICNNQFVTVEDSKGVRVGITTSLKDMGVNSLVNVTSFTVDEQTYYKSYLDAISTEQNPNTLSNVFNDISGCNYQNPGNQFTTSNGFFTPNTSEEGNYAISFFLKGNVSFTLPTDFAFQGLTNRQINDNALSPPVIKILISVDGGEGTPGTIINSIDLLLSNYFTFTEQSNGYLGLSANSYTINFSEYITLSTFPAISSNSTPLKFSIKISYPSTSFVSVISPLTNKMQITSFNLKGGSTCNGSYLEIRKYEQKKYWDTWKHFAGNSSGNTAVAILVRGVDPHSGRFKVKYDLSRLYGYDTYTNNFSGYRPGDTIPDQTNLIRPDPNSNGNFSDLGDGKYPYVVEGDFYLNIPIQYWNDNDNGSGNTNGLGLPQHTEIYTNNPSDTNRGGSIFYKSYFFDYIPNSSDTQIIPYKTDWVSKNPLYYSALDGHTGYNAWAINAFISGWNNFTEWPWKSPSQSNADTFAFPPGPLRTSSEYNTFNKSWYRRIPSSYDDKKLAPWNCGFYDNNIANIPFFCGGTYEGDLQLVPDDNKSSNQLGEWENLGSIGLSNGDSGGVSFTIGNDIYYCCGGDNSNPYTKECTKYDTVNNTRVAILDYPGIDRGYLQAFVINNKAYVGGGTSTGLNALNDWYCWDPSNETWTPIADCPLYVRGGVSFVMNGEGYVGLGLGGDSSVSQIANKNFKKYNPITNTWSSFENNNYIVRLNVLDDDTQGGLSYAVCFVIGKTVFIGTGQYKNTGNDNVRTNKFWYYDFDNPPTGVSASGYYFQEMNSWSTDEANNAVKGAFGFSIGGYGYVCFGDDDNAGVGDEPNGKSKKVFRYEKSTGQWYALGEVTTTGINALSFGGFGVVRDIAYLLNGQYKDCDLSYCYGQNLDVYKFIPPQDYLPRINLFSPLEVRSSKIYGCTRTYCSRPHRQFCDDGTTIEGTCNNTGCQFYQQTDLSNYYSPAFFSTSSDNSFSYSYSPLPLSFFDNTGLYGFNPNWASANQTRQFNPGFCWQWVEGQPHASAFSTVFHGNADNRQMNHVGGYWGDEYVEGGSLMCMGLNYYEQTVLTTLETSMQATDFVGTNDYGCSTRDGSSNPPNHRGLRSWVFDPTLRYVAKDNDCTYSINYEVPQGAGGVVYNSNSYTYPNSYGDITAWCPANRTYEFPWESNGAFYLSPVYSEMDRDKGQKDSEYGDPYCYVCKKDHFISMNNYRGIVFRTDRLPSSDTPNNNGLNGQGYLLAQNNGFSVYKFREIDGTCSRVLFTGGGNIAVQVNSVEPDFALVEDNASFNNDVILSVSECNKAVDLQSYNVNTSSNIEILPWNPYGKSGSLKWFERGVGCYNLISQAFTSLRAVDVGNPTRKYSDLISVVEWVQRTKLTLAACFDIFSHTFSNNWINGTLYAFPYQLTTRFDSKNKPIKPRKYCKDTIYFNETINTFFYRSSPYQDTNQKFIGKKRLDELNENTGGNVKNLLFPTTILDLGPKNQYIQELVGSDVYDGYIADKVPSTTYQEIATLLNFFILSKLINSNFIQLLIPSKKFEGGNNDEGNDDPSIGSFFGNKRWSNGFLFKTGFLPGTIDGDYAQMISINSEIGNLEFDSNNYRNTDLFIGVEGTNTLKDYPWFGVVFSGDNQWRDYISPRRKIWRQYGSIPFLDNEATEIPIRTQIVPFYQWNDIYEDSNSIFGHQNNNFSTNESNFFQFGYQSLDRTNPSSGYFDPDGNYTDTNKGFIANYVITNVSNPEVGEPPISLLPTKNISSNSLEKLTFGAPFHFYFGLKKGGSAMDLFITKYVDTTVTND